MKKITSFIKTIVSSKKIVSAFLVICMLNSFLIAFKTFSQEADAIMQYGVMGGELITGTERDRSQYNTGS
ncbi:MAG: hypothetical protein PHP14_03475 [Candidatus Pacebacteria bacterium]|nr:hypothetical protein [Candidatus Paceibacterota bacterium]